MLKKLEGNFKNYYETQETQARSLGWEDLLEKGVASHASILAWEILWTEEPGEIGRAHV